MIVALVGLGKPTNAAIDGGGMSRCYDQERGAKRILEMGADDRLLTVQEVAAALRVDDNTVRRWIRRGRIEAHNLGGRTGYRVRRSEMDRFLASLSTHSRGAEVRSGT